MFGKKTYGLIAGFDGLYHMPNCCVFSNKVCFPQLSRLIVGLTFSCFNDISEVFVLQGIFSLVLGSLFILLFVVVFVGPVLVRLRSTWDGVSVHIVVKLIFHFFLNHGLTALSFNGGELSRVNDAGSCLSSDLV